MASDVFYLEHHLADLVFLIRIHGADFATHHLRDDLVDIHIPHRCCSNVLAIADDGHRIAHGRHFVQLVRDVHTSHTLGFQVANNIQQYRDLGCRKRRRRLIQNQQPGLFVERLGDFHQLLMAATVIHHRQRDINVGHFQLTHKFRRAPVHRRIVHAPARQRQLVSHENVLGYRQLLHQHQLLMDDDDAGSFGVAHGLRFQRLPLPQDFTLPGAARINARQHFHQRRFTRAVFAAQAEAFTSLDLDVYAVECSDSAEFLDDALHFQQIVGHVGPRNS